MKNVPDTDLQKPSVPEIERLEFCTSATMKILRPILACYLLTGSAFGDLAILAKDSLFVKEQVSDNSGNPVASRRVPAGSVVAVIQDGGPSLFVAHQRDFMWIDRKSFVGGRVNAAVFSEAVSSLSAAAATATLDDFSADANPPADQNIFPSAISPNLRIKELVPLDITARVTSIANYPEPRQSANAWDPSTIAPADFTLAWGPFLMEPTFKSRQGNRQNSFTYRCPLPKGMNASHFAHNFHLVYDSMEIRAKIMQCRPPSGLTSSAQPPPKARRSRGVAGEDTVRHVDLARREWGDEENK